ncbi:SET domain-containing protein-lysine N-methyltransferase [Orrella marina]|uniref:SET domain-containing protein-lysine N-methyltransferase n=1 Tax=Orrella marina TaxID=2163011 RepID=A0A2R4XLY7_9BURK|nr:SET domain-containing protein-lysine N-methyltransferase [Orrella marina]
MAGRRSQSVRPESADELVDSRSAAKSPGPVWHQVRKSALHGQGVFARRRIPAGTRIFEYEGKRISSEQADRQVASDPDDPFHTFFFMLSSGKIIDGNQDGNDSRWINHSCEPNCETEEDDKGEKVFVVAMRDIERGEELSFDYALVIEGRKTAKVRAQYACYCGAPGCRTTMLALSSRAIKAARAVKAQ